MSFIFYSVKFKVFTVKKKEDHTALLNCKIK